MNAILKGVAVVLITISLFAVSVKAATIGELQKLLEGKTTIYEGTCLLNNKGLFPEADVKETTVVHSCIVGVDMNEPGEIYYALIQDRRGRPTKLIVVDKDKKVQRIAWVTGTEV